MDVEAEVMMKFREISMELYIRYINLMEHRKFWLHL